MWEGQVERIFTIPVARAAPVERPEVRAVAGQGLEGDRYAAGEGSFSSNGGPAREVTLIEAEALEAVERDYGIRLTPGESRRNIVTRGVPLNHLVGREFQVGRARLRGVKLCEPCAHLEGLSRPGVKEALLHRGGLNAQVIEGGVIRPGDPIRPS